MTAGIVPWIDKFHVCVLFGGRYRHFTFMRTGDARDTIVDWLVEHGVQQVALATCEDGIDPIAKCLRHRAVDLYGIPLWFCLDIAAAASVRIRPRTLALVSVRAFILPAWQPRLVPIFDHEHCEHHDGAMDPFDIPF